MLYDAGQWEKDLSKGLDAVPGIDEFAGKNILITGATGLICSAVVDLLIRCNEMHAAGAEDGRMIHIFASGRSEEKMQKRFGPYFHQPYFHFVSFEQLRMLGSLDLDYIVHGAGTASPDLIVKQPVETMTSNIIGLNDLLEYGRKRKVRKFLYISSSEVYHNAANHGKPHREEETGSVDPLIPRNSYSVAKIASEALCSAYCTEYGIPAVIVRPGHVYGPTASHSDHRIGSAWAYQAAEGKEIVLKSAGLQVRSYCYCVDCATAILFVLLKGKSCMAYNISNPHSILSVGDLARLMAKAGSVNFRRQTPTPEETAAFNTMQNSSLDSTRLEALGWEGQFSAEEGISHTVQILREAYSFKA